jgi:hypothetical protein
MSKLCPGTGKFISVSGMPHADMFPAQYTIAGSPNRLKYADLTGTRSQTNRFVRVLNDGISGLAKHNILPRKGSRGDYLKPIGTGRYAHVYALEGRHEVLKISGDRTEAVAWARVLEAIRDGEILWEQLPALAKVHCLYVIPGTRKDDKDLYAIIMDRYRSLPAGDKKLISCVDSKILLGEGTGESCIHAPYIMRSASIKQARSRRAVQKAEQKVESFIETMQNLAKIGVFIFDIHGDNLMVDAEGMWRIVDIGVSEVGPPVMMEVL